MGISLIAKKKKMLRREFQSVICKPWIVKFKKKLLQHTAVWPATANSVAKWRSKVFRRALSTEDKATDWVEKSCIAREIKHLV